MVGGVPVAMVLARLARELGYETVVIDGRAAFATRERFPDVDRLVLGWPDEVAEEIGLGPADAVAVLSHDPKFDEPAIAEALRRGCRYVGAIGSRRTQRARRERLRSRASARRSWRACAAPSASTSAVASRGRWRWPSWPRSWPPGTGRRAVRCARARGQADRPAGAERRTAVEPGRALDSCRPRNPPLMTGVSCRVRRVAPGQDPRGPRLPQARHPLLRHHHRS